MREAYAGSDWIEAHVCKSPSPLGRAVANLLGDLFHGIYHLSASGLLRARWDDPLMVSVTVSRGLATFDGDTLTRLVFLCHDRAIRCELEGCGPRTVRLHFHQRKREGNLYERHPSIEEAVRYWRDRWPATNSEGDR